MHCPATERYPLRQFAASLRREVSRGRSFSCLIAGDRQLRSLNRDFLGHDYATDVLSFPVDEPGSLGDLAISVDRARAQARSFRHTLGAELRVLMLHGLLHLMGMDHETDRGRMRRVESRWRRRFGLPAGLIERSSQ
ncbi:MAG: rRNA maturation RNase YbeY [Bryobacteraceae bacterium]